MTRDLDDDSIVLIETELDAEPEKVWRAMTVGDYLAVWLMPNSFSLEQGGDFSFFKDEGRQEKLADCRLREAEPQRRLSFDWHDADLAQDSVVTIEIEPNEAGGTRFRLTHDVNAVVTRKTPANGNEPVMLLCAA